MKKVFFLVLILTSVNNQSQILLSQNFDSLAGWTYNGVYNGHTGVLENGWVSQTNGTNPNCTPNSSAGMACFVSHNVFGNTIAGLYSPAIIFSGLDYRVRFKMFRITTDTILSNEIGVYINSTNSLTGATLLATYKPYINQIPSVPQSGWYDCYVNLPVGTTGTKYIIFKGKANVGFGDNVYIDEVVVEKTPLVDASLETFNLNSDILAGSQTISGKFYNRGLTTINSIDINWQENNGTINTQSLSGLSLATGQVYNYSHSIIWNATPQRSVMRIWLSNINGGLTDNNLINNELSRNINIYSSYFPHNIVYEEKTGAWCGYCPRGIVGLKDMHHNNTDGTFIGIAVHGGDSMTLTEHNNAMNNFSTSFPEGVFNRNTATIVDPNYYELNKTYQIEKLKIPVAKIDLVNVSWNSTNRQISIETEVKFAMNLPNINYNVSVVVLEDNVTGSNQANNYSGGSENLIDWEGINWRYLSNPVYATSMHFYNVSRALLGGYNGLSGTIPNTVVFDTPYNQYFSHTLPNNQNVSNISFVALLIDSSTGQIVNATKTSLNSLLSIDNNEKNTFKIYPNPSSGFVSFEPFDENLIIEVFNTFGKRVYNNKLINTTVDFSFLQKGIYIMKLTNKNGTETQKLILK